MLLFCLDIVCVGVRFVLSYNFSPGYWRPTEPETRSMFNDTRRPALIVEPSATVTSAAVATTAVIVIVVVSIRAGHSFRSPADATDRGLVIQRLLLLVDGVVRVADEHVREARFQKIHGQKRRLLHDLVQQQVNGLAIASRLLVGLLAEAQQ